MANNPYDTKLAAGWVAFVARHASGSAFRRSDLISFLVQALCQGRRATPNQGLAADRAADSFMAQARKDKRLVKAGHVHWRFVTGAGSTRKLIDGRTVAEHVGLVDLTLSTHSPGKWLSVDLETGDVWHGTDLGGWDRASKEDAAALHAILARLEAAR